MKQRIYHIGDQVEIINPRWIKRVGYPLHWRDLIDTPENDRMACDAAAAVGSWGNTTPPFYFAHAVAKLRVEMARFGGNERRIIYLPFAKEGEFALDLYNVPAHGFVGRVCTVDGKRLAKTGTRYAPSSGVAHTADGSEDWWEPGGLENCKTHVILRTVFGEIEACDVKLVRKAKA